MNTVEPAVSFDIFFCPWRRGDTPVEQENRFTGEVQTVLPIVPLTPGEVAAVQSVLREAGAQGPDEFGCYVIEVEDGGAAEVFAEQLDDGCMVSVRGLTPGLLGFLYALLKAADWVMLPVMENGVTIAASPMSQLAGPEAVPCDSAEGLGVLLKEGFDAWQRYRDQVVRGSAGGT
jgi:hypothetical protein